MNEKDFIYSAGFIDGEGCFTTCGSAGFRLSMSNTNLEVLKWHQETFKIGVINSQHLPDNPNWNQAHKWIVHKKKDLFWFIQQIYPFLKVKKKEVEIIIDFLKKYPEVSQNRKILDIEKKDYILAKDKVRKLKTDKHYNRN